MNYFRKHSKLENTISALVGIVLGLIVCICAYNGRKTPSQDETPTEVIEQPSEAIQEPVTVVQEQKVVVTTPETESETEEDTFECVTELPCDEDTQRIIWEVCQEYDIAFPFMLALIEHESDFRPNLTSSTHDYGLCQINRCNLEWLEDRGITDVWDIRQNVTGGAMMLKDLFDKYEDPHQVLMAYNMGEGGARKHWKKGTYTSRYSRAIMNRTDEIERMIEND